MMSSFPESVAIVSNSDWSIYRYRAPLIRALVDREIRVYAVSPPGRFVARIENMGAEFLPWRLNRKSLNIIFDFGSTVELFKIYKRIKPELVQHFTIKPNIYGVAAARLAGVPIVLGGVTGLGYPFIKGNIIRNIRRGALRQLYRIATVFSDRLTFQNQQDIEQLFGDDGTLKRKALLILGGSGVDINHFSHTKVTDENKTELRKALGIQKGEPVVLMACRILYEKGIEYFIDAAKFIHNDLENVKFILAGDRDTGSPGAVRLEDLEKWTAGAQVQYIGHQDDMPTLMSIAHVVVLPTDYPEGVPRVLLEAAALGKPIVASDVPGVTEIVQHRVNGILTPPKNAKALAKAMIELLSDRVLQKKYGLAGRRKIEDEFDDRFVAARYLAEYNRLWVSKQLSN